MCKQTQIITLKVWISNIWLHYHHIALGGVESHENHYVESNLFFSGYKSEKMGVSTVSQVNSKRLSSFHRNYAVSFSDGGVIGLKIVLVRTPRSVILYLIRL